MFVDRTFAAIRWYHSTWQAQVRTLGELTFGSFWVRYIDFVGFLESLSSDPLKHRATMSFGRTIQNHVRMFWGGSPGVVGEWGSLPGWSPCCNQCSLNLYFLNRQFQLLGLGGAGPFLLSSTSCLRLVFKWTKNEFHSLLGSISTLTKWIICFFKKWTKFLKNKIFVLSMWKLTLGYHRCTSNTIGIPMLSQWLAFVYLYCYKTILVCHSSKLWE
jgi:hypothetical protein